MNQDQVKEQLLQVEDAAEEFFVIFSGKSSKKVNGLYHPETREIIIHNRNFDSESELMYTAIHEYAHHIHFTTSPVPVGSRAHTLAYRDILHRLLVKAEECGVYANPFESGEFRMLAERLRREFLTQNGAIMKAFGEALIEAERLCRKRGARFEDFVERVLAIDMRTATTAMKIHSYDITPEIGYSNMATVAGIRNEEQRNQAAAAFERGQSPDQVKVALREDGKVPGDDPVRKLERERRRIKRTIQSLQTKLNAVEKRLEQLADTSSEGS
jgi:hypothetical protein